MQNVKNEFESAQMLTLTGFNIILNATRIFFMQFDRFCKFEKLKIVKNDKLSNTVKLKFRN